MAGVDASRTADNTHTHTIHTLAHQLLHARLSPGRTGRAGATGTAYSFFTAANGRLAREIVKVMAEANQVRAVSRF